MQVGQPSKASLKIREAQTRVITASNQVSALSSITQNPQDLGFSIGESSADLGVVTGTKSRNAEETGQIAGQVAFMVAFAVLGAAHTPTWDKVQDIRVTTVVSPAQSPGQQSVRVSFDRYITNNHGQLWRTELIQDPAIYQEFFNKLSHADTLAKAE